MNNVVEVKINGKPVYFENEDLISETEKVGGIDDLSAKVAGSFEQALNSIDAIISSTVQRIQKFEEEIAPDEFEMKFGIILSGEYGAVVTKVAGEAQFIVKVTYKRKTL